MGPSWGGAADRAGFVMCIPMRPNAGSSQARSAGAEAIEGTLPGLPLPWHSGHDTSSPQQTEQAPSIRATRRRAARASGRPFSIPGTAPSAGPRRDVLFGFASWPADPASAAWSGPSMTCIKVASIGSEFCSRSMLRITVCRSPRWSASSTCPSMPRLSYVARGSPRIFSRSSSMLTPRHSHPMCSALGRCRLSGPQHQPPRHPSPHRRSRVTPRPDLLNAARCDRAVQGASLMALAAAK